MLLKEDYFKDIDITDDDIIGTESQTGMSGTTVESIIKDAKSKYNQTLTLNFQNSGIDRQMEQDSHMLYSRLNQLFELYNIDHSELYVISGRYFNTMMFDNTYTVTQSGSCVFIDNKVQAQEPYNQQFYNNVYVVMYIRRPYFRNIKQMLRFMDILLKIIFESMKTNTEDSVICSFDNGVQEIFNAENYDNFICIYRNQKQCVRAFMDMLSNKDNIDNNSSNDVKLAVEFIHWFFGGITMHKFISNWNRNHVVDYTPYSDDEPFKDRHYVV